MPEQSPHLPATSHRVITWALVLGLFVLLAAHPALFERERAFLWVVSSLMAVTITVFGFHHARRFRRQPPTSPLSRRFRRRLLEVSVSLFAAGLMLSYSFSNHASMAGLAPPVSGLFLLGLGRMLGANLRLVAVLAGATLSAGAIVAGYALCQHLGFDPLPAATLFPERTVAVFENPNHLGSFMAALLPIAVGGFLLSSRVAPPSESLDATAAAERLGPVRSSSLAWYPLIGMLYAALLLAGSRGAWVGCLAGLVFLLWAVATQRHRGSRWHLRRVLAMIATVVAVTLWLASTRIMEDKHGSVSVGQRMLSMANVAAPGTTDNDQTLNHRYFLWQVAWQLILDHPVLGIGYDRFADHAATIVATSAGVRYAARHAHNEYLNCWAEGGIFTLIGFLGMAISVFGSPVQGGHDLRHRAAAASLTAILVHGLVSYPLYMPLTAFLFWILLGIINTEMETDSSPIRH